jgi:hypothetical protein
MSEATSGCRREREQSKEVRARESKSAKKAKTTVIGKKISHPIPVIYSSGKKPPPKFMPRDLNGLKLHKGHAGPLSKPAQVAIHLNLRKKLLKSPRASATTRSKVRVMLSQK